MKRIITFIFILLVTNFSVFGQAVSRETSLKAISDIKSEAVKDPQTINFTSALCDVTGSRVTWSKGFDKSIEWAASKFKELGLSEIKVDEWEPEGKSWEVKRVLLNQTTPYFSNLIASPRHFSPGTPGLIKGKAIHIEARTEADLEKYKGKLQGAIVFVSGVPTIKPNFEPFSTRYADSSLKKLEDAVIPSDEEKLKQKEAEENGTKATLNFLRFMNKRIEFCMNEGAVAIVEHGGKLYGTIQGLSAILPKELSSVDELFYAVSKPDAPKTLPQILISFEQYASIVRILRTGADVNLEIDLEIGGGIVKKGKNIFAELPGTDLKNEVVIIGAHIDTQGPSIGATDNAVGVAVCMEAMRLLKKTGVQPRRTIRICLWGGEEQGYLGSKDYAKKYITDKLSSEKIYMYFNTDNGAGRFRGIYLEERTALKPVMKKWFDMIDMKLISSISKTEHTDHMSFNSAGVPGFQFIQDYLDYFKIYHTNMDRIERIPLDDVRDNAIIMASLAYLAAIE